MFLSLDMSTAKIPLFSGSTATHSHTYPEPTLMMVSSIMNSDILAVFLPTFFGLCPCIHFHVATWLLLTVCKNDNALEAFLQDKPRKYNYNPWPMCSEDVLFLVLDMQEKGHLQDIRFPKVNRTKIGVV